MGAVAEMMEAQVAQALRQVERAVDDELERLNTAGDDDLEQIRKRRVAEMRRAAEEKRQWLHNGHGELSFLHEKDFFEAAKASDRVVVTFYRPGSSRYSDDLVDHMRKLAQHHLETRFVAVNVEKAPFLIERLKIWCLPSVTLVEKGRTDKTFHGLGELVQGKTLDWCYLEQTLFDANMLHNTALSDAPQGR